MEAASATRPSKEEVLMHRFIIAIAAIALVTTSVALAGPLTDRGAGMDPDGVSLAPQWDTDPLTDRGAGMDPNGSALALHGEAGPRTDRGAGMDPNG